MKHYLFLLLLLLTAIYASAQENTGLTYNDIMIVGIDDTFTITSAKIGTVQFKDKVFTSNCSYYEVMDRLTTEAKQKGGNLMKIISHKLPDMWSSCHRITADVYMVADPKAYEKKIEWSAARKLTPEDFKGKPDNIYASNVAGLTYAEFGFETNRVTMFKSPKFFVFCTFKCYDSWIKEEDKKNKEALQHEQTHFDITEVYTRKLLKALTDEHMTVYNLQQANDIYQKIAVAYKDRQRQYDDETRHGIDKEQQKKWNDLVANELQSLSDYARN